MKILAHQIDYVVRRKDPTAAQSAHLQESRLDLFRSIFHKSGLAEEIGGVAVVRISQYEPVATIEKAFFNDCSQKTQKDRGYLRKACEIQLNVGISICANRVCGAYKIIDPDRGRDLGVNYNGLWNRAGHDQLST